VQKLLAFYGICKEAEIPGRSFRQHSKSSGFDLSKPLERAAFCLFRIAIEAPRAGAVRSHHAKGAGFPSERILPRAPIFAQTAGQ
jgi:hypothetical protein